MLESLNIDYLGVSLDSLLLIVPPEHEQEILETVQNAGVDIATVGYVEKGQGAELVIDGQRRDFTPRFRESAYTPIKKMVGDTTPDDFEAMCKAIDRAAEEAISKKRHIVEMLGKQ
jgi:hydrogenase expression/formation protein